MKCFFVQCVDELLIHNQQVDELGLDPDYQSSDTVSDNGQQHLSEVRLLLFSLPTIHPYHYLFLFTISSPHFLFIYCGFMSCFQCVEKLLDGDPPLSDIGLDRSSHHDDVAIGSSHVEELSKVKRYILHSLRIFVELIFLGHPFCMCQPFAVFFLFCFL